MKLVESAILLVVIIVALLTSFFKYNRSLVYLQTVFVVLPIIRCLETIFNTDRLQSSAVQVFAIRNLLMFYTSLQAR